MKYILLLMILLSFALGDLSEKEMLSKPLKELQEIFLAIDINAKELDLDKAIKAIKLARKKYPLDDKLKMVDIELEHRKANESR